MQILSGFLCCLTKWMDEDDATEGTGQQPTVAPTAKAPRISAAAAAAIVVLTIIADGGDKAACRFLEFFAATLPRSAAQPSALKVFRSTFIAVTRGSIILKWR